MRDDIRDGRVAPATSRVAPSRGEGSARSRLAATEAAPISDRDHAGHVAFLATFTVGGIALAVSHVGVAISVLIALAHPLLAAMIFAVAGVVGLGWLRFTMDEAERAAHRRVVYRELVAMLERELDDAWRRFGEAKEELRAQEDHR